MLPWFPLAGGLEAARHAGLAGAVGLQLRASHPMARLTQSGVLTHRVFLLSSSNKLAKISIAPLLCPLSARLCDGGEPWPCGGATAEGHVLQVRNAVLGDAS